MLFVVTVSSSSLNSRASCLPFLDARSSSLSLWQPDKGHRRSSTQYILLLTVLLFSYWANTPLGTNMKACKKKLLQIFPNPFQNYINRSKGVFTPALFSPVESNSGLFWCGSFRLVWTQLMLWTKTTGLRHVWRGGFGPLTNKMLCLLNFGADDHTVQQLETTNTNHEAFKCLVNGWRGWDLTSIISNQWMEWQLPHGFFWYIFGLLEILSVRNQTEPKGKCIKSTHSSTGVKTH